MLDDMDFLLPLLIFLLIGIVTITFGIAWMIAKARYQKKLGADEATAVSAPPSNAAPRDVHLLALDRAPDGAWRIAINGKYYPSLEAVPDDTVRRDVVAGLKEVVTFARSYVQKDQTATKPPAPPPQPAHAAAAATPSAPAPVRPEDRIPPAEKPVTSVLPAAVPPPASLPVDKLRGLFKGESVLKRPDAAPMLMPTIDLAHEIGEIVAEMQAQIPSMAQRTIKLQNIATGGVQFVIDDMIYFDVNEIPDADVQALIRAATKEWERR